MIRSWHYFSHILYTYGGNICWRRACIIYVVSPNPGTVTRKDNSYLADDGAAGPTQTGDTWDFTNCPVWSVTLTKGVETIKVCIFLLCLEQGLYNITFLSRISSPSISICFSPGLVWCDL